MSSSVNWKYFSVTICFRLLRGFTGEGFNFISHLQPSNRMVVIFTHNFLSANVSDKFQSTLFFIHAHNVPDPFNLLLISIYFKRNLLFWGSLIKVPQSIPKLENKDTSWGECTLSTKKLHKELKNVSKLFHDGIACKSCYFKVRNFRGLKISWSDKT